MKDTEKIMAIVAVAIVTLAGVWVLKDKDLVQYGILAIGSLAGGTIMSGGSSTVKRKNGNDGETEKVLSEK